MPISAARVAWAVAAAGAAANAYALAQYWSADTDSADRALIVLASAWAGWTLWPSALAAPRSPRPAVGTLLAAVGGVLFLPAWFVALQVGPRSLLLWWMTATVALAAGGLLLHQYGLAAVRALRFPLLFPFLALPIPTRILSPVQGHLQEWTTTLAAALLPLFGVEVARDGFVLSIPSGKLGVVEACSGVRSVTALLAIAVFLSHLRGFGVLRGLLVVALSMPAIVLVNAVRVTGTALLQEWVGPWAVVGWRHDVLGFAAVLVGAAVVYAFTALIDPGLPEPEPTSAEPVTATPSQPWVAAGVLALVAVATVGVSLLPGLARTAAEPPDLSQLPTDLSGWTGTDLPQDPEILAELGCGRAMNRLYTDRLGHQAVVWVMYWSTKNAVRGYHHPDICLPNRGFALAEKRTEDLATPGGRSIPLTYREFTRNQSRQVVVYWTQEGPRFWTEADERAASTGLSLAPLQWTLDRLASPTAAGADDRIVVLVGSVVGPGSDNERNRVRELAAALADQVYRTCPWADPGDRNTVRPPE